LVLRLHHRLSDLRPEPPSGFYFGTYFPRGSHGEQFRRGFPDFIDFHGEEWTAPQLKCVAEGLAHLVATSTVRGCSLTGIPPVRFAGLLGAPAFGELRALEFSLGGGGEKEETYFYRALTTHSAIHRLRQLSIRHGVCSAGIQTLAAAQSFRSLRQLNILFPSGSPDDWTKLLAADWARVLRRVHMQPPNSDIVPALATGLGGLPELHTLELPFLAASAVPFLAGGRFPRLVSLEARSWKLKSATFIDLLRAEWFGRLRVLDLTDNQLGDKAAQALATHPVARNLRILNLTNNPIGSSGLMALARTGAFPELASLNLYLSPGRKSRATERDILAFVSALAMPRLRQLTLSGRPVGELGAKALAANPSFANLTHLNLMDCGIGEAGEKALLGSPYLANAFIVGYHSASRLPVRRRTF
jgi:hypothetical protein